MREKCLMCELSEKREISEIRGMHENCEIYSTLRWSCMSHVAAIFWHILLKNFDVFSSSFEFSLMPWLPDEFTTSRKQKLNLNEFQIRSTPTPYPNCKLPRKYFPISQHFLMTTMTLSTGCGALLVENDEWWWMKMLSDWLSIPWKWITFRYCTRALLENACSRNL